MLASPVDPASLDPLGGLGGLARSVRLVGLVSSNSRSPVVAMLALLASSQRLLVGARWSLALSLPPADYTARLVKGGKGDFVDFSIHQPVLIFGLPGVARGSVPICHFAGSFLPLCHPVFWHANSTRRSVPFRPALVTEKRCLIRENVVESYTSLDDT